MSRPSSLLLSHSKRTTTEKLDSMRTGLMVAARQGNEDVARYLLDAGVNPNTPEDQGPDGVISAAAESGSVRLIRLFLQPEYKLDPSNAWYTAAVLNAAQIPDSTVRLKIVKILWAQLKTHDLPHIRTEALFRACKVNDPELAEFVLSDGPADIYAKHYRHVSDEYPLVAAFRYQSFDIVRIILNAPFVDVPDQEVFRIRLSKVLASAIRDNHLPIFLDVAARQDWLTADDILVRAAKIEHGVEAVIDKLGPYNFDALYTYRRTQSTLGAHALSSAAEALRTHNVAWLLNRGARTQKRIRVHESKCSRRGDSLELMEELLKSHNNPGFEFY